jgi:hypothetical protein
MPLTEEEIDNLEKKIPELAKMAGKQAYLKALMSGDSVLEVKDNKLVRTFPNGEQQFIKNMKPDIAVKIGQKLHISHLK